MVQRRNGLPEESPLKTTTKKLVAVGLPGALLVAIRLGALAALVLGNFETAFLFKISHR